MKSAGESFSLFGATLQRFCVKIGVFRLYWFNDQWTYSNSSKFTKYKNELEMQFYSLMTLSHVLAYINIYPSQ